VAWIRSLRRDPATVGFSSSSFSPHVLLGLLPALAAGTTAAAGPAARPCRALLALPSAACRRRASLFSLLPRAPTSFAVLQQAPPGGEAVKGEAEPDEATLLWLRRAQTAPVSGKSGAPPPELESFLAFGRAPAGAGGGARDGALPKRA
jgi:hypothetical protein